LGKITDALSISSAVIQTNTTEPTSTGVTSTFRGFGSRIAYNSETFSAVSVFFDLEYAGDVECSIYSDDMGALLATTTRYIQTAGAAWRTFIFDIELTSSIITGTNFYVLCKVVALTGNRMNCGSFTGNANLTATTGHANRYITTSSTLIQSASPFGSVPLAVRLIASSALAIPFVDSRYMELALPPKIYAVVGKEMNIYFDNIAPDYAANHIFNAA
jgi:hypothetical protein